MNLENENAVTKEGGKMSKAQKVVFSINPSLKNMAQIAPKDPHRYSIGGVNLKVKGSIARAEATDGKVAALVRVDFVGKKQFRNVVIPRAEFQELCTKRNSVGNPQVSINGSLAVVNSAGERREIEPLEGNFPEISQTVPDNSDLDIGAAFMVDPELMIKLLKSIPKPSKKLTDKNPRTTVLIIPSNKPHSPSMLVSNSNWLGLIMPIACTDEITIATRNARKERTIDEVREAIGLNE